jgi:hypothetical protein
MAAVQYASLAPAQLSTSARLPGLGIGADISESRAGCCAEGVPQATNAVTSVAAMLNRRIIGRQKLSWSEGVLRGLNLWLGH